MLDLVRRPRCHAPLLLSALLFVALSGPRVALAGERTDVVTLNKFNFADNTKRGSWFVKFYTQWCPHCKRLAPIWEELALGAASAEWAVKIAEVDCGRDKAICDKLQVHGVPTLLMIKDGDVVAKYSGEHNLKTFEEFLLTQKSAGTVVASQAAPAQTFDADETPKGTTATSTQALWAVATHLFNNFPTKSKIVNLYCYGGFVIAALVGLLLVCFRHADQGEEEDDDHDKTD
mmetsp:Transcript_83088/g.173933  ORF Transcript_83088/g.173933 Transcript_83088/m.173933 type:complete len:232 (-) Transcript_83088:57-752(-)